MTTTFELIFPICPKPCSWNNENFYQADICLTANVRRSADVMRNVSDKVLAVLIAQGGFAVHVRQDVLVRHRPVFRIKRAWTT